MLPTQHWAAMPQYRVAGSKLVSDDVTHLVAMPHSRLAASQYASGDVSHWVQGGYAQYEAGSTGPVSGDATHWGTVARQYKAGSKPVSE